MNSMEELFSDAGRVAAVGFDRLSQGYGSAASVQGSPMGYNSPVLAGLTDAISRISGISEATSARSEAMAQSQRQWSANQAAITRGFNAAEAAKNRNWQEYMSNTAHQREVEDLRAAGLNPVLSAMGGNGAAVTSGSSASASNPSGSTGQADSMTTAIVQLLGNFLTAQTHLYESDLSARTNLAVADKYNAISKFVAELQSLTSKDVAVTSAEASKSAAYLHYLGSLYGADTSASINASNIEQERWRLKNYPNNPLQVISSLLDGFGVIGDTVRGNTNAIKRGVNSAASRLGLGPVFEFDNRADAHGKFGNKKTGSGSFGGKK